MSHLALQNTGLHSSLLGRLCSTQPESARDKAWCQLHASCLEEGVDEWVAGRLKRDEWPILVLHLQNWLLCPLEQAAEAVCGHWQQHVPVVNILCQRAHQAHHWILGPDEAVHPAAGNRGSCQLLH